MPQRTRSLLLLLVSAAFAVASIARAETTIAGTGELEIEIAPGRVTWGSRVVVDIDAESDKLARSIDGQATQTTRLLSLVGPALSIEVNVSEEGGCGPTYHRQRWETRDVRTGKLLHIRELFEETTVVDALRADKVVQEVFAGTPPAALTLDAILQKLATTGTSFAVHSYDSVMNRASVRIAFVRNGGCGMCPNMVSQIGLLAVPRAQVQPQLADAVAGRGFTMLSKLAQRSLGTKRSKDYSDCPERSGE